jgi:hypothetical protein
MSTAPIVSSDATAADASRSAPGMTAAASSHAVPAIIRRGALGRVLVTTRLVSSSGD